MSHVKSCFLLFVDPSFYIDVSRYHFLFPAASLYRTFPLLPAPGAGQQSSWSVLSPVAAAHGPQSCPASCWAEVGETPAALCPGTGGMNRSSTSQDGIARSPRLPHTWKLPEQFFSLGRETLQICNHFAYWGHRPPAEGRFHPLPV